MRQSLATAIHSKSLQQKELKEEIIYDPDTGIFTWPENRMKRRKSNIAGYYDKTNGYIRITFGGIRDYAHRLAFLYMTGEMPKLIVDHIDKDRTNNRWSNLRECNKSQNASNRTTAVKNKNGYVGVNYHRQTKKFQANIRSNGVSIHLGYFDTAAEASIAYESAAKKYNGEYYYGAA